MIYPSSDLPLTYLPIDQLRKFSIDGSLMPEITLETPRLILRPMTLEDSSSVQRYFSNWNIIKYIGSDIPWPYPADGAKTYLRDTLKKVHFGETYLWGLTQKGQANEVIGAIEYRPHSEENDHRGFWLGEPFWGQGLMTEAVVATQDYVFHKLKKERLIVRTATSNEASRAIKRRCGAEIIGVEKNDYLSGDTLQEIWEIKQQTWMSMGSQVSINKYRVITD